MGDKEGVMLVDLCKAPDDIIVKILKRVPAKELLTACTKVSKQWHRILSAKFFWKEKLEEVDGYRLPWRRLASQPVDFYKMMALKRPFLRNLIRDSWDLTRQDKDCCQLDGRWQMKMQNVVWREDEIRGRYAVQVDVPPPKFSQQPEMDAELGDEPVLANLSTCPFYFQKSIVIRLANEGLTDELMDHYRPTIVVSELAAHRLGNSSEYQMYCYLSPDENNPGAGGIRQIDVDIPEMTNDNDRWLGAFRQKRFQKEEAEKWNLVQHEFKQYKAGMRYLFLNCIGCSRGLFNGGFYGIKLACCSILALCEGNVSGIE